MQSPSLQGFRLSHQQRRWWLLHRGGAARQALCAVEITGDDPGRLRGSLAGLVERHSILRTTFQRRAGLALPIQVVLEPPCPPAWEEIDLSGSSAEEREERVQELWRAAGEEAPEAAVPGPPLRALCVRLEPGLHRLILSLPALCADARTLPLLAGELAADAELRREEESVPYVQVSEWQHEMVEDEEEAADAKAFWRDREEGAVEPLRLPWQRDPAVGDTAVGPVTVSLFLGAGVTGGLSRLAASSAPLEAALLTAWAALLARLTGNGSLVLAVEADGRGLEELADVLGPLARAVPVRLSPDLGSGFAGALATVAAALREALDWQQHWIPDPRGDRTTRDVGFAFEPLPTWRSVDGLELRVTRSEAPRDLRPLTLRCIAAEGLVTAVLEADPERFDPVGAATLAAGFRALVEAAVERPESPLQELPVLPAAERERLLESFNATASPVSSPLLVHRRFELQAASQPDREALRSEAAFLTYAELNARANRLAHRFRALGAGPETVVALWLPRSLDLVVALLAVLKAGGAYLPVDPTQPAERLTRMLVDSGASLLVTRGEAEILSVPGLRHVDLDHETAQAAALDGRDLDIPVDPDGLAYVIFTSGSTGRPKGVAVSHRQLASYLHGLGERLGLGGGASFATVSTFAADLGNTSLFGALCGGGCLHVLTEERIFDGEAMATYFESHAVDVLKIVPSHFQTLYWSCPRPGSLLPRRCLVLGGEACPGDLVAQLLREAPHLDVLNHYGPTETTVGVCTHRPERSGGPLPATIPIGRPLANSRLYVLDERLEPLPAGVPGELFIGGAGVARGYLGQGAQTAERFLPDPYAGVPGARMYRTGDRVRHLPGGFIESLGRLDRQVKIRGFRVEPEEVALALREHPGVEAAVVVPFAEAAGGVRLVAYTVPRRLWAAELDGHKRLDAAQLRAWLSGRLPEPMCPAQHFFLKSLPLTRNGKVDLRALPSPEQAGGEGYVAPRNPAEQRLAAIWAEVLGLERVGVHDNYFEIGGDSMQSIRVIARAAKVGLRLSAQHFFEHQTVARLAAALGITGGDEGELAGLAVPLTPAQRRFLDAADDPRTWVLPLVVEVRGAVDRERLALAFRNVAARHDALRLRFAREVSGWSQRYGGEAVGAPEWLDLPEVPAAAVEEACAEAAARLRASLDPQSGPTLRLACLDFGAGRPARLLLACHPLVADEPSWRILVEDLRAAYRALEEGREVSLPAATRPFRSWAEGLTALAGASAARAEAAFWLDGRFPAADAESPPPTSAAAGLTDPVAVSLERDETQALIRDLAGGSRADVEEVLLLALAEAYGERNHGAPLVFDLESDGRRAGLDELDVSRTVGCFTCVSPRCLHLLPTLMDAGDRLRAVKEQLRATPRQGLSFGALRDLTNGSEPTAALRRLAEARLAFRYVGNLDEWAGGSSLFAPVPGAHALKLLRRSSSPLRHQIGVHAWIADGRLHTVWTPGPSAAPHQAVELADGFVSRLRALLATGGGAGAASTTDFPLAGLSQEDMQRIASLFGSREE